jgi:hypothetical protein
MKKRFKTFIFALAAVLLIPTSAFASTGDTDASDSDTGDTNVGDIVIYGAGDWDTILSADYEVSKSVTIKTRTVLSGGGDLRVCMSGVNKGNIIDWTLWDEDIISDDKISSGSFSWYESGTSPKQCTNKIDVRAYKDGDNVEIYLKLHSRNASLDTVHLWIYD